MFADILHHKGNRKNAVCRIVISFFFPRNSLCLPGDIFIFFSFKRFMLLWRFLSISQCYVDVGCCVSCFVYVGWYERWGVWLSNILLIYEGLGVGSVEHPPVLWGVGCWVAVEYPPVLWEGVTVVEGCRVPSCITKRWGSSRALRGVGPNQFGNLFWLKPRAFQLVHLKYSIYSRLYVYSVLVLLWTLLQ